MLKYSFKQILRQLFKGNRQLLLNILGLSVAFASILFLSTYVSIELKKGKTLDGCENIYQLSAEGGKFWSSRSLKEFEDKFPEIEGMTKLHKNWSDVSSYEVDNKIYTAGKILIADEHFFDVFHYNLISGNLHKALELKDQLVITESEALKVFGHTNVIGQNLRFRTSSFGVMDFTVSAVVENQPTEAMLRFDAIIPIAALNYNVKWYKSDHWGQSRYEAFLSLSNEQSTPNIEKKLNDAFQAAAPEWAKKDKGKISLKPYTTLFFAESGDDALLHGDLRKMKTLGAIMLVIILLAQTNFINLNTAQKLRKARDMGIHKTLGANGWNSFLRVISEILPVLAITLIIAIVITYLSLPGLNGLFGSTIHFANFINANTLLIISIVLGMTLFLSATIIIIYLQHHQPLAVLKNNLFPGKKENLRNALLIAQFTLSVTLIISSIVIFKQNTFMRNYSMGFTKGNILYIPLHDKMKKKSEVIRHELEAISEVQTTTFASHPLGKTEMGWGMSLNDGGVEKRVSYEAMLVEKNFFDFFGIKLIDGEGFRPTSIRECEHIFNESAIKTFGIENIKNAHLSSYSNATGQIIGVVEDFNFESLHHAIKPIGFICSNPENMGIAYMNLNVESGKQLQETMGKIEKVWKKFANGWPFEYYFLDQTLDNLYKEDQKFSKVFLLGTILSIFIGCLGLLSTAIFVAEQRIKEIGIRKVNGAKVSEVLAMLNKDFVKWVAIAFVIATPIAYYAMNKWLENFAYKTELSWWIFALAGVLAMGIALLTVSFQSYKAAIRNPIESLRYE